MRLFAIVSPQVFVSDYPTDDSAEHSKKNRYQFIHHGTHSIEAKEENAASVAAVGQSHWLRTAS
jgi:hypothetical protein